MDITITYAALMALGVGMTKIEWTEKTLNLVTGCKAVSAACLYCYAALLTRRLETMPQHKARYGGLLKKNKGHFNGQAKLHWDRLKVPSTWTRPYLVFICSMADLFYQRVPDRFIQAVFAMMWAHPQHTFQLLTKHIDRVLQMERAGLITWPPNVWLGTTVENLAVLHRVDVLRQTGAHVKFLSCEPLLERIHHALNLAGIDWVIGGGEFGRKARPMDVDWIRGLRDLCAVNDVPFFYKQWGSHDAQGRKVGKKQAGRVLDGRTHDAFPHGWKARHDAAVTMARRKRRHELRLQREAERDRRLREEVRAALPVFRRARPH